MQITKIIDLNVMDWANVTKIHTPPSTERYFPPWQACAVQRQFGDWECILAPRGRAPFGADQRERSLEGMPKVIADIAQHNGNVLIVPISLRLIINVWDANCLLAINAQWWRKRGRWGIDSRLKHCVLRGLCDRDLKRAAPCLPLSEEKSSGISLASHASSK